MSLWNRLRNTLRPSRVDADLALEVETHLAEMQDDGVKQGLTPAQARRAACLQFGNPRSYCEISRERYLLSWLETFLQDVRYALRQLKQSTGFAVSTVLLLALGIGVNITIFTLLNGVVLASLPLPQPDRLVILLDRHSDGGSSPPSCLRVTRGLRLSQYSSSPGG
jgi:hypothetical protein